MNLDDPLTRQERALAILAKRQRQVSGMASKLRDLKASLGPKQLAYVESTAPRKRLKGARQVGKSHIIVVDNVVTGFESRCDSMYVAPTSKSARNAVWSKLGLANDDFGLGLELQEGLFRAVFPNKSTWDFEGAHDTARVQRLRGKTIGGRLTVDEAGFFPDKLIRELLTNVATAMFLTTSQRMAVASSPALQRRGYFFELGRNDKWEQHALYLQDNPAVKDVQAALLELREANAWTEQTPAYRREGLGEEVDDATDRVYQLSDLNLIGDFDGPDSQWTTVMTVDFGSNDQSAWCVAGWKDYDPALYCLHVEGASGLDIEDVALKLKPLIQRYAPVGVYGDHGGGGKQHADYLRNRHGIAMRPVTKKPGYKKAVIDAFNADCRRGNIKVLRSSPLVDQMQSLEWDPTALSNGDWEEHPSMPNDLCDVFGVYAFNHARHFRAEAKPAPKPVLGTADYWKNHAAEGLRIAQDQAQKYHDDIAETQEDISILTGNDWE